MRSSFRGYYPPTKEEYERLWKEGTIVLDTNVLLDIYRLPSTARDELLTVLDLLKARIWIPHQVALEFQRQRLSVISDERKATEEALSSATRLVDDLKRRVEALQIDKRGLGISGAPLLKEINDANVKLVEAIQTVHDSLPDISVVDPIRDRVDGILGKNIGKAPLDQESLDKLVSDGEQRFANRIPPGFADVGKDKNPNEATFVHEQLIYQRKFGDLILWRQIVEHVKASDIKSLLIITGDRKEDWWRREQGRTLGPHPELTHEIVRTGVELFWMYTPVQFVEQSSQYTSATVSPQSVDELKLVQEQVPRLTHRYFRGEIVGDIDSADGGEREQFLPHIDIPSVERSVEQWLLRIHGYVQRTEAGFPDFLIAREGEVHGYDVKFVRNFERMIFSPPVINSLLRGYLEVREGRLSTLTVVVVIGEREFRQIVEAGRMDELRRRVDHLKARYPVSGLVIGSVLSGVFEPLIVSGNDKHPS